jgi:hypothetical protein
VANATTQLAAIVQRDKRAAGTLEDLGWAMNGRGRGAEVRRERFARKRQQQLAILLGGHLVNHDKHDLSCVSWYVTHHSGRSRG